MVQKYRIRRGDTVVVLSGKDKGATGEVLKVVPSRSRVVVKGVAVAARHQKPTQENPQGRIVRQEASIHISNVAHADPKDGKPTRVGVKDMDGRRALFAKRSGELIQR
jgi:large subunit ribosomal protein L24